ncbi:J domain-containing protein [Cellulophaga sp. BC115SP]|uniref:J domain-containing protein n=1 Tax=Cellulophaga sp. BC115SP TaxID=2683263 RepID=UPI001411C139|nr:J domain-containing protein [Cellulophaga sp. BC115SP]NBB29489.1 DnaJ domain-containing protein [Cellulophaga sp. BC115SP]
MKFTSVEEIIEHFSLNAQSREDIKKILKNLIKEYHPDKNMGDFQDDTQKSKFHEINSALEYLNSASSEVLQSKQNEMLALVNILTELSSIKKEEVKVENFEAKNSSLKSKLNDSVNTFHKKNITPKITSLALTSVLTTIWLFPSIVKDHPILKTLYTYNEEFTLVWIICLSLTAIIWFFTKYIEKKDEMIKQSFKLESTQNNIFLLYTIWMRATCRNYTMSEDNKFIALFTKEDFIYFLMNRFSILDTHAEEIELLSSRYERIKLVEEIENHLKYNLRKNKLKTIRPLKLFPVAGEIDIETAQLISDLLIERLITKEVISKTGTKSLSDTFQFAYDY